MKKQQRRAVGLYVVRHVIPAVLYCDPGPAGPRCVVARSAEEQDAEDAARIPAPVTAGDQAADGVSGYVEWRALTTAKACRVQVIHAQAARRRPQPMVAWILQVEPQKRACHQPALSASCG